MYNKDNTFANFRKKMKKKVMNSKTWSSKEHNYCWDNDNLFVV